MSFLGKPLAAALGVAVLSGTVSVPLASAQPGSPVPALAIEVQPAIAPAPLPPVAEAPPPVTEIDADELDCLAKVVLHEAGNQSRTGQLAVAQVVMNRVRSPRFPDTVCDVVMQRGQFFNVHAYHPRHDARWHTALEIARDALAGTSEPVIGRALFFHAASAPSFRRPLVGRIGDHVFYR